MNTSTTENMGLFMLELGDTLYDRLRTLNDTGAFLQHRDVTMGFARNIETFSPYTVAKADFEPIGSYKDKAIIVYGIPRHLMHMSYKEVGFGLYDDEDSVCVRLDIDALRTLIMEPELLIEQFTSAEMLIRNLDKLLS